MPFRPAVHAFALSLVLIAGTEPGHADSAKALPLLHGAPVSIQGYGKQNPACRTWTDGCVLCSSDGSGTSQCSTPGIACQPHGLTCKAMVRPK